MFLFTRGNIVLYNTTTSKQTTNDSKAYIKAADEVKWRFRADIVVEPAAHDAQNQLAHKSKRHSSAVDYTSYFFSCIA